MTSDQIDRIADHVADFSLAYLQAFKRRTAACHRPHGEGDRYDRAHAAHGIRQ
jgi:hypothetical protein